MIIMRILMRDDHKINKGDKKMKNLAKILVLILSVALVCGMLVLVTSADNGNVAKVGDVEYATLKDAFDAASALTEGDKVVKLIADCSVTETIAVTKDVTVDLNGYELSSSLGVAFTVNNPVNFTITGEGSIKLDGGLVESTTTVNDFTVNVIGKAGTKGIADYAFEDCTSLKSITISKDVEYIGIYFSTSGVVITIRALLTSNWPILTVSVSFILCSEFLISLFTTVFGMS